MTVPVADDVVEDDHPVQERNRIKSVPATLVHQGPVKRLLAGQPDRPDYMARRHKLGGRSDKIIAYAALDIPVLNKCITNMVQTHGFRDHRRSDLVHGLLPPDATAGFYETALPVDHRPPLPQDPLRRVIRRRQVDVSDPDLTTEQQVPHICGETVIEVVHIRP